MIKFYIVFFSAYCKKTSLINFESDFKKIDNFNSALLGRGNKERMLNFTLSTVKPALCKSNVNIINPIFGAEIPYLLRGGGYLFAKNV